MQSNESSYRSIFKSTFLFGFVQVFNIVMKAAINKAVAILLGTEGMGVISLYNSAVNMLRTVAGLGIPQSAVRDVAEANATYEIEKLNRIITVTKKIVWFTALLKRDLFARVGQPKLPAGVGSGLHHSGFLFSIWCVVISKLYPSNYRPCRRGSYQRRPRR